MAAVFTVLVCALVVSFAAAQKSNLAVVRIPPEDLKAGSNITAVVYLTKPGNEAVFSVNLATDNMAVNYEVPLHVVFDGAKGTVRFNSYQGEKWKSEQTNTFKKLPAMTGLPFGYVISLTQDRFKVYYGDGTHIGDFAYRIPLDKITHLFFRGSFKFAGVKTPSANYDNRCNKCL